MIGSPRFLQRLQFATLLFLLLPSPPAHAADVCTSGLGTPAFLSAGLNPNLLLLLDNSASMLDMAYIAEQGYCFDDGYANNTTYAGYFDPAKWYAYNTATSKFEEKTAAEATAACNTATYRQADYVCVTLAVNPVSLTNFTAKGNLLNWATASKLDIEKKILTGGKYESGNSRLIMEGRGCSGRRFVKEVSVTKVSDNSQFHLTLGIRPPSADERNGDLNDDTTRIDLFSVSSGGFNNAACEAAITLLQEDPPNQGQIKVKIDECMGYSQQQANDLETNSNAAFNHGIHSCWYYSKHDQFQPGGGDVNSMKQACEGVYDNGVSPTTIEPDDQSYPCADDYVGRCWVPAIDPVTVDWTCAMAGKAEGQVFKQGDYHKCLGGTIHLCTSSAGANKCVTWNVAAEQIQTGGAVPAHWQDNADACIDQALKDYCGVIEMPEVVDPTDAIDSTGQTWNLPAVLVDSGVTSQLHQPLVTLSGRIASATAPSGLLHEFKDSIRMGAMSFNNDGSKTEFTGADPNILYSPDANNKDGAALLSPIDQSPNHTTNLVTAVNNIKAKSWTPLGEAMYNAIGYFGQNSNRRLNETDFAVGANNDPIQGWCQENHVLLITEGASTADRNPSVTTFTATRNDGDNANVPVFDSDGNGTLDSCNEMSGNTLLDDLTWFAQNGATADLYTSPQINNHNKQKIKTHIVISGTLRDTGATECSPDELMREAAENGGTTAPLVSEDPAALEANLRDTLNSIRAGASSGSASSVVSSSRGGEGAIYQALFWPQLDNGLGGTIDWVGEVHALFVDETGKMHEDSDGNQALGNNDLQVTIFFDESVGHTKACIGAEVIDGVCPVATKELNEIKYLWSANDWLAEMTDAETRTNRGAYLSNSHQRYLFTWNDLNNDGITDSNEVLPFTDRSTAAWNWDNVERVAVNRGTAEKDFGAATAAEANTIINWVRGDNSLSADGSRRNREIANLRDLNNDGTRESAGIWRLGDVINSSPMSVSRPAEAYHLLYKDRTYANFVDRYKNRRHMIYFGGNDGILHAVNGGFFDVLQKKFCLTADCQNEVNKPELGAELWGYVPYNLLPHLKCLTSPDYKYENKNHKYFVDLRPRIFDVKIFTEEGACAGGKTSADCIHPDGWGTILVGGMRFGGAPMSAKDDLGSGVAADNRLFTSAYFILDITNPEAPPTLLGELTRTSDAAPNDQVSLGYSTVIPTMVPMNDLTSNPAVYNWYLVLGSGPTTMDGRSDQPPKIGILPLSWVTDANKHALRIPNQPPEGASAGGSYTLLGTETGLAGDYNGFVSDPITMDFDLSNFFADTVYFGTVDCRANCNDNQPTWGGTLYRLVTRKLGGADQHQITTTPQEWEDLLQSDSLSNPLPLIDVAQPITAAPAVASDGDNFWVYFGTGRFIDAAIDKTDSSQQSYYGIKEPYNCNREFTWATVHKGPPSELQDSAFTHNGTPGTQGILQVDQILVESATSSSAPLSCIPNAADANWGAYYNADSNEICAALLLKGVDSFASLKSYITGTPGTCSAGQTIAQKATGTDGWFRNFPYPRERNLGQAAVLAGLTIFTTYQPYSDICLAEGQSNLYTLYYQTGTPYYKPTLGVDAVSDEVPPKVLPFLPIGPGLTPSPVIHVAPQGITTIVQTSTGAAVEIPLSNPPEGGYTSSRIEKTWSEHR